jgi:hypothetical protein
MPHGIRRQVKEWHARDLQIVREALCSRLDFGLVCLYMVLGCIRIQ